MGKTAITPALVRIGVSAGDSGVNFPIGPTVSEVAVMNFAPYFFFYFFFFSFFCPLLSSSSFTHLQPTCPLLVSKPAIHSRYTLLRTWPLTVKLYSVMENWTPDCETSLNPPNHSQRLKVSAI